MNTPTHESRFGPASELIDIAKFIESAVDTECSISRFGSGISPAGSLCGQASSLLCDRVTQECRVSDIKDSLLQVWNNPELSAHVLKNHELNITSIHSFVDKSRTKKRKRKFFDPEQEPPEVIALQKRLDAIQLSSWNLRVYSAPFMRALKNSDQNAVLRVKQAAYRNSRSSTSTTREALITVSVYNRLPWGHSYLYRSSQHTLLASQTLGDVFEAIPCTSKAFPEQIRADGAVIEYRKNGASRSSGGCVVCVEGLAYGDGQNEVDYADMLVTQFAKIPLERQPAVKKAKTSVDDTLLLSLSLRINEPYWLLHQGNCEHFIVVDQIRLLHPLDPCSGYPLTLQMTPLLLDLCRSCTKIPAVWSILGDIRLGESPYVICEPCWRNMGEPHKQEVTAVPLPRYELGQS